MTAQYLCYIARHRPESQRIDIDTFAPQVTAKVSKFSGPTTANFIVATGAAQPLAFADRVIACPGLAPRDTLGAFGAGLAPSLFLGSSCAVSGATWTSVSKFGRSETAPRPSCGKSSPVCGLVAACRFKTDAPAS